MIAYENFISAGWVHWALGLAGAFRQIDGISG